MREIAITAVLVALVLVGLGFLVAPTFGWATPFALPHHFTFNGKTYYDGDANVPEHFGCSPRLARGDLPLRPTGSISGYLTGDKTLLLPHYEWKYPFAYRLYIRSGSCYQEYVDIADGP